jgi:hypothetical protein
MSFRGILLRLTVPLMRRTDLHCLLGLASALLACIKCEISAPGIGESCARARPRRSGILPLCGPARTSVCSRSVGSTRFYISSKKAPDLTLLDSRPLRHPCRNSRSNLARVTTTPFLEASASRRARERRARLRASPLLSLESVRLVLIPIAFTPSYICLAFPSSVTPSFRFGHHRHRAPRAMSFRGIKRSRSIRLAAVVNRLFIPRCGPARHDFARCPVQFGYSRYLFHDPSALGAFTLPDSAPSLRSSGRYKVRHINEGVSK